MRDAVIVAGARTPIGRLSGALGALSAAELGARAISGALERAAIEPDAVEYVILGQVLQAGAGQITARQAAVGAGIPLDVPALTINKVCLSGLNALYLAVQMVRSGDAEVVVAGGMESMTQAPYLVPGARAGLRLGDARLVDSLTFDGLTDPFTHLAMGEATDSDAARAGISRQRQDELALASHERASEAAKAGRLAEEIVPVEVPGRKGTTVVEHDEGIRPETTNERLASLAPAFSEGGSITAGNASQISDGAAALVVTSAARAAQTGVTPLGRLVAYGQVAGPDTSLLLQPARALRQALGRASLSLGALSVVEINEAFAAVVAASLADLGIDDERCNPNGGAIALGHPIGASGARLALSVLSELRRRGGGIGAAALCGGGGQGDAAVLSSID
jgi:acetyl-CoA C-acetyltransferase